MKNTRNMEIRVVVSGKQDEGMDAQEHSRVSDVIRTHVLSKTEAPYFRVDVKIRRKDDRSPYCLIAYLLRKDIYLAEVVRVDVDSDYQVTGTIWNYDDSKAEEQ
jgi:hypothetical protein